MRLFQTIWESCWIEDKASDRGGEKVQKRFFSAEQGSPSRYCFKKVVIQKLSSTECSLEDRARFRRTIFREGRCRVIFLLPPPLVQYQNEKKSCEPTRGSLTWRISWKSSSGWLHGIIKFWYWTDCPCFILEGNSEKNRGKRRKTIDKKL